MFKNFIIPFPSADNVYALINGELTACKVLGVTADTESCNSFVLCESPDGVKNSFKASELYASVEGYKKGETAFTIKPELRNLLPGVYEKVDVEGDTKTFFKMFYWVMADGEPEKRYIDAKRITFDSAMKADIKMPAEFYATREDCIKWNDITVVEEDGTKHVQKSALRSLVISDKQREIIDELKAVFQKAKDANIVIGYNHDFMEWIAVDKTEHPDLYFEWGDSITEEQEKDAVWVSTRAIHDRFRIDLPAPAYIPECDRCIILEQEK